MPSLEALLGGSLIISLLAALSAGLLSSLSPCTLPTAVMVVAYVGGYDNSSRYQGFTLSLAFVLGLSLTLATVGAVVSAIGGLFLENTLVWYLAALIAVLMGANLLGFISCQVWGLIPPGSKRAAV
ncbi:cytochrome c biogenesis protein CcdA [Desulforamulus aquiferis]|uniref:cytochrome c biogenesis protein CcdA n=1 Tax=Desulforamulus aquiferis TaxID=1397668 RepID=UPI003F8D8BDE